MNTTALDVPSPSLAPDRRIAAGTSIGHVHLKVANLERAIAFYRDVLGFEDSRRPAVRRRDDVGGCTG